MLSFAREVVLLAAPFYMQMTVDEVIARGDLDLMTVLALGFALLVGGPQKTWPARACRFPRVVREGGGVSTPKSRARRRMKRILITGAAGKIGNVLRSGCAVSIRLVYGLPLARAASRGSSQSRNPPRNALLLSPARHPSGSFFNFLTLPPPITTSSGSSTAISRSTTSST